MRRIVLVFAVLGLLAAGCGGGEDITIDGQWARTSPMMAEAGAAYMNITSADGDVLLSASVDPSIAGTVEIHETVPSEDTTDDSSTDMSDDSGMAMMKMIPIDSLELPAGETVQLMPGGYHIMLINLAQPLEIGQKFDLTLNFENAGEKTVEVEVMADAPQ